MDSYELLQNLDKEHGKKIDYTVTVSPEDISNVTKNISKERREKAKKELSELVNKSQDKSKKVSTGLQLEEIVVDNSEKDLNTVEKTGDER